MAIPSEETSGASVYSSMPFRAPSCVATRQGAGHFYFLINSDTGMARNGKTIKSQTKVIYALSKVNGTIKCPPVEKVNRR